MKMDACIWRFLRSSRSLFLLCVCMCVVSCVKRQGKARVSDATDTALSDAREEGSLSTQSKEGSLSPSSEEGSLSTQSKDSSLSTQSEDSSLSTQSEDSVKCDYYYFEASTNKEHWEDEIIRIEQAGGRTKGTFWVTSDEFVSAREGYLPGFTVLDMQCLTICGDSISFLLDSHGCLFFSAPVDVSITSDKEAEEKGYHEWLQEPRMFADSIRYVGTIRGDTLFLDFLDLTKTWWRNRKFVRIDEERMKRIDRRMDAELEMQNRREYWK